MSSDWPEGLVGSFLQTLESWHTISTQPRQAATFVSDLSILGVQECWHTPLMSALEKQRKIGVWEL